MITDAGDVPVVGEGRVPPGLVFRISGNLAETSELPALDVAGLRSIVDLRGEDEDRVLIREWAREQGVNYVAQPMPAANRHDIASALTRTREEAAEDMCALYRRIVDEFGGQIAATIGVLAEGLPAGYGCAAGKDRTGIVTAFLHVLLGVSKEEAARRYVDDAPSPERLGPLARDYLGIEDSAPLPAGVEVLIGTMPEAILAALGHAEREHGGIPEYLESHGLPSEAAARLRAELLVAA